MISSIEGLILGATVGDLIGSSTTGKSPYVIKEISISNDISNNIYQLSLAIETIAAYKENSDKDYEYPDVNIKIDDSDVNYLTLPIECIFANKLKTMIKYGINPGNKNCDEVTMDVYHRNCYVQNPICVAKMRWIFRGKVDSSNYALPRTLILGSIKDPNKVIKYSKLICQTTHYDSRCVASSIYLSMLVHLIMYHGEYDIDCIIKTAMDISLPYLVDTYRESFIQHINYDDFMSIKLGIDNKSDRCFKCIGATTLALRCANKSNRRSFKEIIETLAKEGGSANVNCCVAGGIIGLYLGEKFIPREWLNCITNRTWINSRIKILEKNI